MNKEREAMSGMRKTARVRLLAVVILAAGLTGAVYAANPGESGMLSLRQGFGAREAAMGGAGVAASEGASALYWNPANNVFGHFTTGLVLQHHRYLGLFSHEAAGVAHSVGSGVLGFTFSGLYADEIDRYGEEQTGVPLGTFRPYDVAFGVSYARRIGHSFGWAATVKMVYEKIDIYSDTGLAFDLFMTHQSMIDGLVFAASVTNLGKKLNLREDPFDLPTAVRLGAAWTPNYALQGKLTVAADMVMPNDSTEKAHVGAEYRLRPEFSLRIGSRLNYENQGITAGAGFKTGRLGVDYAFEESKVEGFDNGHKFSLNVVW